MIGLGERKGQLLGSTILGIRWVFFVNLGVLLQPFSANLVSARALTPATGTVQIKLSFIEPPNMRISRRSTRNSSDAPDPISSLLLSYVSTSIPTHSLTNLPVQTLSDRRVGTIRSISTAPGDKLFQKTSTRIDPASEYKFERPSPPAPTPTLADIRSPGTRANIHFSRSCTISELAPVPLHPTITIVSTPCSPTTTPTAAPPPQVKVG